MRRTLLLVLGTLGSVLAAGILYISAESVWQKTATDDLLAAQPSAEITNTVMFPALIPGTSLIAQDLSSYEGPFLEDGTDREVTNVAALHIYNSSDREIFKVYIELKWDEVCYIFAGDHIPPKSTVVILEQNGYAYRKEAATAIKGWQWLGQPGNGASDICVTDKAMGTIVVTNMTDEILRNVCVYYKSWLSPPDVYMGGITYMVQVPVLLPRQTQYLYPRHYARGYSKVVSVTRDVVANLHS